jgi:hypothetical protein
MKMFPNGKEEQFRDYVGLSLSFIGNSNSEEEVEAKFWISIRKSDAEEVKLRYCNSHLPFSKTNKTFSSSPQIRPNMGKC